MDKIKKIELELKELPYELRRMRVQKYKLGQEINRLTNEKNRTIEAITKSKRENISFADETKKLNKKLSEIKALCKKEEEELARVTKEIAKKLKEPQLLNAEIDEKQEKLLKSLAKLDQNRAEIKDNNKALKQDETEVKRKDAELKRKIIETANNNVELRKAIDSYNQKIADLDIEKDKVISQLDKAKGLNTTLGGKIKEANANNVLLEEKTKANDKRANFLEAQKEQYKKRLVEVVQEKKEAEATKANYERALKELEEREKEINIAELKITKGIRTKEIEKELKKLEAPVK